MKKTFFIKGSLLVEMLIALSIMSIALISAVSAFGSAQKAQRAVNDDALVLESLSFLIEDINREAKYSTDYTCTEGMPFCRDGVENFKMTRVGVNNLGKDEVEYNLSGGSVWREITSESGGVVSGKMTPGSVEITRFDVFVYTNSSTLEPDRARIVVEGRVKDSSTESLSLQITLSARI
jgi:hypothetical protein